MAHFNTGYIGLFWSNPIVFLRVFPLIPPEYEICLQILAPIQRPFFSPRIYPFGPTSPESSFSTESSSSPGPASRYSSVFPGSALVARK